MAEPRPLLRRFCPIDETDLVDHARRHNLKRGGGIQHVSLEETAVMGRRDEDLVALDEAMRVLAPIDP